MTKSSTLTIFALALTILCTQTYAAPVSSAAASGQVAALISENEYCLFLPPNENDTDIAENEDRAVAFCNVDISTAPNARALPSGFIQSLHFVHNEEKDWVQITGRFDRTKYNLKDEDGGGQYDMRAPVGAVCNGYSAFVQITEPDQEIYCLRCCKNKGDCPVNKSEDGCESVLGGIYD
ncbi:hypothetical protein BGZ52_001118 [Haplosporangium bisporale]|nr:hypothetical protein BGZ52_001118 [Haplosporangium bisporale]